ncbi:MAG: hypothetical protein ACHRHE_16680, partial [Tepidisphaerales bacterium]
MSHPFVARSLRRRIAAFPRPFVPSCLRAFVPLLFLLPTLAASAQELLVAPENGQGVYTPGQPILWTVQVKGTDVAEAAFIVKKGGITELSKGKATL